MNTKRFILSSAFFVLLFLSCTKQPEGGQQDETFDPHPVWTDSNPDAFWDKHQGSGFQLDTAWDDDATTIYF
jgi:hypothetical protein